MQTITCRPFIGLVCPRNRISIMYPVGGDGNVIGDDEETVCKAHSFFCCIIAFPFTFGIPNGCLQRLRPIIASCSLVINMRFSIFMRQPHDAIG
jgi:hypothetical protein